MGVSPPLHTQLPPFVTKHWEHDHGSIRRSITWFSALAQNSKPSHSNSFPDLRSTLLYINYILVMATVFPSGLDLLQTYSLYIHAKHCCEVHYLNSAVLGWALSVLFGSSFLLCQTGAAELSPYTVISLSRRGHNVPVYKALVTFPDCQCILSLMAPFYIGLERVLCKQPQSHANYLPSWFIPRHPKKFLLQH